MTFRIGKTTYTFIFMRDRVTGFLIKLGITYALNLVFDLVNKYLLSGGSNIWDAILYLVKLVFLLSCILWAEGIIRKYLEKQKI